MTDGHILTTLPGYLLRRAANAMMADLAARLAAIDLRLSEATVLLLLGGGGEWTSSDIGKALDIQRANMVPLLARVEDAGLITRKPINRKSQAIELTKTGEARLAEVRAVTDAFERELLERIPAPHRAHFAPALAALLG